MSGERRIRHQHCRRTGAECHARSRADHRDKQGRWSDGKEAADGQVETDLEQEQQHPYPRQDVKVGIDAHEVKFPETDQVPERYAGHEFSEDRRLTDPYRKVAAELGGSDDDREAQGKPTQFVELSRGARRHRQPSGKQEDCGSHQHDVNARTNSHGCASNIMAAGAARSIESGWVDVFGLEHGQQRTEYLGERVRPAAPHESLQVNE
jgi:hypothetical protein